MLKGWRAAKLLERYEKQPGKARGESEDRRAAAL
jgi:hypothetical protein